MASNLPDTSVHESSKSNCGKKIVALRIKLKISQVELGKRVGASTMSNSRQDVLRKYHEVFI
jgi:hypothetical protein